MLKDSTNTPINLTGCNAELNLVSPNKTTSIYFSNNILDSNIPKKGEIVLYSSEGKIELIAEENNFQNIDKFSGYLIMQWSNGDKEAITKVIIIQNN